jgi:hypothetical protein
MQPGDSNKQTLRSGTTNERQRCCERVTRMHGDCRGCWTINFRDGGWLPCLPIAPLPRSDHAGSAFVVSVTYVEQYSHAHTLMKNAATRLRTHYFPSQTTC